VDQQKPDHRQPAVVYLVSQQAKGDPSDGDIDLWALWSVVWVGKWLVLLVTILIMSVGLAYALLATEWWEADVVLSPTSKQAFPTGLAQLGGLANLAGIDIPSASGNEPLAVLRSKSLARDFIEEQNLMPILFAEKWDPATAGWKSKGAEAPDIRDGVKYFDEVIRSVAEDKKAGLVTLAIKWKSGPLAADWANLLVKRLNDRLRTEAIQEAQSSINYLQKEMLAANVVNVQQAIGQVLEDQMQKMALARANEEFAFKVIDSASPPKRRIAPKRSLILALSTMLGGILGILIVIIRASAKKAKATKSA
jgi:LPS O-antigen subunit length determinant protein (WzzB/FepE family)